MKKFFMFLAVAALGTVNAFAQEAAAAETELAGETMHQVLMQKFLEGGWGWMLPVLRWGLGTRIVVGSLVVGVYSMRFFVKKIFYLKKLQHKTKKYK